MNKKIITVVSIIAALIIIIFVSFRMNKQTIETQKEILARAEVILTDGKKELTLNMETIKQKEETFEAVLDTSSTEPRYHDYAGVQLKNILLNYFDLNNKTTAIISAADGYSVAYSIEEILTDKNVYIAYMEDGKYLGSREDGGRGPYESIVVSDMFSNRRCKWITKIEVK